MMFSAKSEKTVAVPSHIADSFIIANFIFLITASKADKPNSCPNVTEEPAWHNVLAVDGELMLESCLNLFHPGEGGPLPVGLDIYSLKLDVANGQFQPSSPTHS